MILDFLPRKRLVYLGLFLLPGFTWLHAQTPSPAFGETQVGLDSATGFYELSQQEKKVGPISAHLSYSINGEEKSLDLVKGATVRVYRQSIRGVAAQITEATVTDSPIRASFSIVQKETEPFVELQARAALSTNDKNVRIESFVLFQTDFANTFLASVGRDHCRFWRDWNDIWHAVGSRPLTGKTGPDDVDQSFAYHAASIYGENNQGALTFLYDLPNRWFDSIEEGTDGIVARDLIRAQLAPKAPLLSDCLSVSVGPRYTNALVAMEADHRSRQEPSAVPDHFAWNSWEYYHEKVAEADILENVTEINKIPWLKDKIRYVVIDEGWQKKDGSWEASDKFPDGMANIATKIAAAGFVPGIWTAPLIPDRKSPLALEHPDWLLHDGDKLLTFPGGNNYYLDVTNPQARHYLYVSYQRLYKWGYRYFKTDFLLDGVKAAMPGRKEYRPNLRCYDPNMGLARGMRAAMETIRAAIGEDSWWVGCGTDVGSGAGLMDSSRVGGDIAPFWTRVPHDARSVINHFYLQGRLFLNDPDFALVKGPETYHADSLNIPATSAKPFVTEAFQGGPAFSADDARSWASLVILSGGMATVTERIKGLNDVGLSILRTVFDYAGGNAAVPIDLDSPIPRVLLRQDHSRCLLGLFNWDNEKTATVSASASDGIPFPKSGIARDLWTGKNIAIENGEITQQLSPHQSMLLTWPTDE